METREEKNVRYFVEEKSSSFVRDADEEKKHLYMERYRKISVRYNSDYDIDVL